MDYLRTPFTLAFTPPAVVMYKAKMTVYRLVK